ncbi:MAG: hypothetical protein JWN57_2704 [Frankiales bacterium]|jgi:hypothetical protein|nr:hypothetical protein [Frankiales bacterium]
MPGVGDVGAGSFEFYEGIRILIPGATAVGLYAAADATLIGGALPSATGLAALAAALLVGLVLHFVDAPSKSLAYSAALPSNLIRDEWPVAPRNGMSVENAFFILVDEEMPQPIRARGLYSGSMYRIGYEINVLLATATVLVFLIEAWPGARNGGQANEAARSLLAVSSVVLMTFPVCIGHLFDRLRSTRRRRYAGTDFGTQPSLPGEQAPTPYDRHDNWIVRVAERADRSLINRGQRWLGLRVKARVLGSPESPGKLRHAVEAPRRWDLVAKLAAEVPAIDRLLLIIGLSCLVTYLNMTRSHRSFALAVPAATLPLGVFLVRYQRGHRKSPPDRRVPWLQRARPYWDAPKPARASQSAASNALPLSLAFASSAACAGVQGGGPARLLTSGATVWALASIVTLVLVIARGHEKKWFGASASQKTWLRFHQAELTKKYFVRKPVEPPEPAAAEPTEGTR